MAAHRRLLVSARRHADRRLLAERRAARRPVASRPGRAAISRKGLSMAGGPKIAILGAGSVGCFIGGAWAAAGVPVTFIGRPQISQTMSTSTGSRSAITAAGRRGLRRATSTIAAARRRSTKRDIIALTVKSGDTAEAAARDRQACRKPARRSSASRTASATSTCSSRASAAGSRSRAGMVPYNVAYLGDGRFHKGVAGDLFAEDAAATRALAEADRRAARPR